MDAMDFSNLQFPCFLLIISFLIPFSGGQAPPPAANDCTGIFLSYDYISGSKIYPYFSNHSLQPYSFKSRITLLNTDSDDLKSWNVFVGFQHREILVSASQAVLSDGSSLPAAVGNGTYFSGFPQTDLNNAIDTAGDWTQILVQIDLTGTQFGVSPPGVPMPANISIANDGFDCAKPGRQGNATMYVCCSKNPNFKANISEDTKFLPRQDGDLTIDYDIIQAYEANYLAQVTISNNNPLGRLDNWKLNWEWMQQEFIYSMKGAYPQVIDPSDCIFGAQGMFYQNLDFSPVLNCQKSPTIVDLPPNKANDTIVGMIPFCCRNGTLLPPSMDPSKSKSAFQLQVYKMPPNLNRTQLFAPQNWKISGEINPDYQCAPPRRVSPTQFPNTNGLQSTTSAIASWQVVCNITQHKNSNPQCCVSFSAFYNESVIPCKTCACGCPAVSNPTCSTTTPALFLPSEALLVPFENRTKMALAWADLKHFHVPNQMPCGDNCGVSINWHVFTDHSRGWSARITLFNWEGISYGDWFTAVELDKAYPGYEGVYSFNGTTLPELNNTIFMQGLPGLNYLVGEVAGANPRRDTPIPGKQQSVISFTKKKTPGINVVGGDGFPTKVFFNGEECSVPSVIPSGHEHRAASINLLSLVLVAVVCLVMMDQLW